MHAETVTRKNEHYTVILVPSASDVSKSYRVDVVNKRCDCPAWKFQRGPYAQRKTCKHLRQLGFRDPVSAAPTSNSQFAELL